MDNFRIYKTGILVIQKIEKKVITISAVNSICGRKNEKTFETVHSKVILTASLLTQKVIQLNAEEKLLSKGSFQTALLIEQ